MAVTVVKGCEHQFYRKLHEECGYIIRIGMSSTRATLSAR